MSTFDLGYFSITPATRIVEDRGPFGFTFIKHCEDAAEAAAKDAAEEGLRVAKMLAPEKTGRMADTIRISHTSSIEHGNVLTAFVEFSVGTNHWDYAEWGAAPHDITGRVRFFWEREDRYWTPGNNTIHHPGMKGKHFMERGLDAACEELPRALERHYNS